MSWGGLFARLWRKRQGGEPSAGSRVETPSAAAQSRASTLEKADSPLAVVKPELGPEPQMQVGPVKWGPGVVVAELYQVGERCGAGGMGVVDRVRHLGWGQDLAVKSPQPGLWAGPAGVQAFLDEAKVWVDLMPHPHICTCHYVRVLNGVPRIFAEYVPGGSLAEALRAGRISTVAEILDVAIQMAWGLQAAHDAGVVHQDVKPANVLLTASGTAKITDFGLARAQARAAASAGAPSGKDEPGGSILLTQCGLTPAYASPEQLAGQKVGRGSDIWSWAVSVLELFIGQVSWRAGSAAGEALEAYLALGSPSGRAIMPKGVIGLLRECLTLDPAKRPAGMGMIAQRLVAIYEAELERPYPRQAAEAVTHLADGLNNKALSLLDLGQHEQAEACWQQALQADPRHPDATFNWGLLRWRTARITDHQLIEQLEAVRQTLVGVGDGRIEYLLGLVHLEQGDVTAAAELLEEAAQLAPTDPEIATAQETAAQALTNCRVPLAINGHSESVTSVEVTPDGRYALSGSGHFMQSGECTVRWWDLITGQCLRTFTGHKDYVKSVAMTPDARRALSASFDGTVRWWDLTTGRCLSILAGDTAEVTKAVTFDGRHVLSASDDGALQWRDVSTGRSLHSLTSHAVSVSSGVGVTPDGHYAVSASIYDGVQWWDLATGRCLGIVATQATSIAVTSDARYALFDKGRAVILWDLASSSLRILTGHTEFVLSVAVTPDGRYALSGSMDMTVRWWDLANGRCLRTLSGNRSFVRSVALTPDARYALSGGDDGTVRGWNLATGNEAPWSYTRPQAAGDLAARAAGFQKWIIQARQLIDSNDIASSAAALHKARAVPGFARHPELLDLWHRAGREGRRIKFVDARLIRTITGRTETVWSVGVTADGRHALSGSADGTVRWWDLTTGSCLHTLTGHTKTVVSVAVTPDGHHALSGSTDGTVRCWDLTTGSCLHTLTGHTKEVSSVAVTPDGHHALSGSTDGTVRWWDLATGSCLGIVGDRALSVAVTPDGRHALSGSMDGTVRWWDLTTGSCLHTLTGHTEEVSSVAVTPDARHALSGAAWGWDGPEVRLWDLTSGRCLRTLIVGYARIVFSVALTPDARHALSGSDDGTVRLWDLSTGRCLRTLTGHKDYVRSLAMTSDAVYALSGSPDDDTMRLWEFEWDYEFSDQ
ncbi:MAG: protein kinase [Pseudonocardiales bacterium]|nr:protein kinase [Pseudonocardiales bacterium]